MTDPSPSTVNEEAPPIVGAGRYSRYPAYRESGVGWLGEIPAHWQVKRTRHVARLESGHTPSRNNSEYWKDCNIPWFTLADVWQIREGRKDVITETKEKISEMGLAHSAARLLPKGTVILSRTASVGFSAIAGVDLATTQDYVNWVCKCKSELRPEYLLLVFRSMNTEFQRLTMGSTHRTIYMPDVRGFSTPLPTIKEQRSIVSFVHIETEKIDALVAKKERLIELLQERRTALITRAVTKGIDPDATMKDSGVEWLGEIPSHWGVSKLKSMVPKVTVGIVVTPSKYYVNDGIPCLRSLNIAQGSVTTDNLVSISEAANALHRKSQIFAGDIVVVRTGRAGTAVVVPPEFDGANCVDLLIIRQSSRLHSRYLYYFMNSGTVRGQVVAESVGSIQEHYNTSTLANLVTPKMPIQEQRSIAGYLDRRTAEIDALLAKVHEAIDHLKELRTALIAAAVTGKIDVRETAA